MMKPNEASPNPYEITNTNAFGQYTNVAITFDKGLENSIIELVSSNGNLLMSDVLEKFGNYLQVHKSVNKLLLSNRIVVNELEEKSYPMKKYDKQLITLSDPNLSQWLDLAAQPCLTCPIFSECDIKNPVSPATCQEFAEWLEEEVQLEFID
ncbi:MAG: hypothetical protein HeimC2_24080 [Candidatus Heimdallarchaeota archaeon LC_2]|nr:MAG: hypothetical protein HeimC2_24080 [Candidatus Heimdallarchaeota archaeon LC_2]